MGNRVEGSEQVARILNNDWFEDGRLMHLAFALNYGETYLSVNRLAVPTCPSDVKSFVESHSKYSHSLKGAILAPSPSISGNL